MTKTMRIELIFSGGGVIDKEITYYGNSLEEIAKNINKDENELLQYMLTGNDMGQKAFCFCGFMFRKEGLVAAKISEPFLE